MEKILVSACLLGQDVRYDGGNCLIQSDLIQKWQKEGRLIALCPEMAGGLPAPRPPCEIREGRVIDASAQDWTKEFDLGAKQALELVEKQQIKYALMKERSPSCGVNMIYDGTFSSIKIPGQGRTSAALAGIGVQLFSEFQLEELNHILNK